MKKPICSSCMVTLRTRSWTQIDSPLPTRRLPPPPVHHQRLDGKCTAKETFITGPLWDAHSQELSVVLVRGACVDGAGAPVNRTSNPGGTVIRPLLPHLSHLCGRVCFQHFQTCKPARFLADVLVVGRDFQYYKSLKGFNMTK